MANVEGNADLDSQICLVIVTTTKKPTNHETLQDKPNFKLIPKNFAALRPLSHIIF